MKRDINLLLLSSYDFVRIIRIRSRESSRPLYFYSKWNTSALFRIKPGTITMLAKFLIKRRKGKEEREKRKEEKEERKREKERKGKHSQTLRKLCSTFH